MKWYSTQDAAALIGLSPRRVRAIARSGILEPDRGPRRQYRFSFQDLVLLRTAAGLHRASIPSRRIRAALSRLRRELPSGHSLSELRIAAEADNIVVHDGRSVWDALSGQYDLDFTVAGFGEQVAPLAGPATSAALAGDDGRSAQEWYEAAVDLEAYAPAEAIRAYGRALEIDPKHPDAHVNLGRLVHHAGDFREAERHYRAALTNQPHAIAAYDLGVALEDQGRNEEAADAYRQAIAWDPELSDAHYNLARLLESRGDQQAAVRHLATCKQILDARGRRRG